MKRILTLLLSLAMMLSVCVAESAEEGFCATDLLELPSETGNVTTFFRTTLAEAVDVKAQMCRYLYLPMFASSYTPTGGEAENWTITATPEGWCVMMRHTRATLWMVLGTDGTLMQYSVISYGADQPRKTGESYTGELPANTDEAILSLIQNFAERNGMNEVKDYQRQQVTTLGGYAVEVTSTAQLDQCSYSFTTRLDVMGFSRVERTDMTLSLLPEQMELLLTSALTTPSNATGKQENKPVENVEAVPTLEQYEITVDGVSCTLFAMDKAEMGNSSFATGKGRNLSPQQLLSLAVGYTMQNFGVTMEELTQVSAVEYGYRETMDDPYWQSSFTTAEWQVDFFGPDGYDCLYELRIRDADGVLIGIWGPEDGNG